MGFDIQAARAAGYNDDEIADYLAQQGKFDIGAARKAGYSSNEIISHLAPPATEKGTGIVNAFKAGVDDMQGALYAGTEAVGEAVGSKGLAAWGKEGRERNAAEAAKYGTPLSLQDIDGVGSAARWAAEGVARTTPSIAGAVGGAALGALAAPAVGVGAGVGAAAGGLAVALPQGVGQVQQSAKEKDPNAEANAWTFGGGAAVAALDTVLPGKIGGKLVARFGVEAAEQIASKAMGKIATIGMDAGTEGATEAVQQAIQEVAAGEASGKGADWENLPRDMLEAGALGAVAGGAFGGVDAALHRTARVNERGNIEADIAPRADEAPQTVELTPDDLSSPLPDDLIALGKATIQGAEQPYTGPRFKDAGELATLRGLYPDKADLTDEQFLDWFGKSRAEPGVATIDDGMSQISAPIEAPAAVPTEREAVYDEKELDKQIGWFDRNTGAFSPLDVAAAPAADLAADVPDPTSGVPAALEFTPPAEAAPVDPSGPGSSAAPVEVTAPEHIDEAATRVAQPTDAQKAAGNYRKAHVNVQGLDIAIENPAGSTRSGVDPDGKPWSVEMPDHYGYVKRTEGADGDAVDVYIGPEPQAATVFVIDQQDADTKGFDEHKAMLGYPSEAEALAAYDAAFSDGRGPERRAAVTPMSVEQFKGWLKGDTSRPAAEATPAPVSKQDALKQKMAAKREQAAVDKTAEISPPVAESDFDPAPLVPQLRSYVADTNKPLSAEAIGKHLKVDAEQARRVMASLAARTDSGVVLSKGKLRRKARRTGPVDALTLIASSGGIADTEGHDLAKGRGLQRLVPGAGALIRPSGRSVDQVGEMLWEQGYFGPPSTTERPDTATVLDFIEAAAEKKAYSVADQAEVDSRADVAERDRAANELRFRIDGQASEMGFDLTDGEIDDIADLVEKGLSIDDAIYEKVNRDFADATQDAAIELDEDFYEGPLDTNAGSENAPGDDGAAPADPVGEGRVSGDEGQGAADARAPSDPAQAEVAQADDLVGEPVQPQRSMTQAQRADLDARQQQGMARRGGQEAISDQDGGLFSAERDQTDMFAAAPPAATAKPGKIDDFGEKLIGARKDYAAEYADRFAKAKEADISAVPLSQSWPEPDYQKMLDGGADPYVVASVRAMRDAIPSKPSRSWKLNGWTNDVAAIRSMAERMISGDVDTERVKVGIEGIRALRDLQGSIDLYLAAGHDKSLRGIRLTSSAYSMFAGVRYDPPKTFWSVEKAAKASAYGNWPSQIATGETKQEAIDGFLAKLNSGAIEAKKKQPSFDIYSRGAGDAKRFIIGKKVNRTGRGTLHVDLQSFGTLKEARAYLAENRDKLTEQFDALKEDPAVRKASNSPRIGEDHRDGADVTPERFAETFGFRGVQFGNYVEGGRRQEDLNEAYDGLMDLAGVLDIPPKAISLDGKLGLAFGARGRGGKNPAAAHYEPGNVVINLTKRSGAGSLAHEWWHALDNYFGAGSVFMTTGPTITSVRPEMVEAFRGVMAAIRQTSLKERSKAMDKLRTKEYWSTDIEMSARAFESFVIAKLADQSFSNDYLANIVSERAFGDEARYPYPTAGEIPVIREGFDRLFETIESEQTASGVRLYSRSEPSSEPVARLSGNELGVQVNSRADMTALRGAARAWFRKHLLSSTVTTADGREVRFNDRGMKKIVSKGPDLIRALPAVRAIVEKGEIIETRPGDGLGTRAMHLVAADVEIGGETRRLGVFLRETPEGHLQYDLTLVKSTSGGRSTTHGDTEAKASFAHDLEAASGGGLNLVDLGPDNKAGGFPEDVAEALRTRLRQVGLADRVALNFVATLDGPVGQYHRNVITLAMDGMTPGATLDHEIIHALRPAFRPAEWAALTRATETDGELMASVRRRYPGLDVDAQLEEGVADLFARIAGGQEARGFVRTAFDRVTELFKAIGQVLRGQGWTTVESVVRAIDRGDIGARGMTRETARPLEQAAYHGSPHDFDQFSTENIGDGEGHQAYGWGLYFAGKKAVAEHYRRMLAGAPTYLTADYKEYFRPGRIVDGYGGKDKVIEFHPGDEGMPWDWSVTVQHVRDDASDIPGERLRRHSTRPSDAQMEKVLGRKPTFVPGRLYEVDIPSDDEYLLWDRPLGEQSEKVRNALGTVYEDANPESDDYDVNELGQSIYHRLMADFARRRSSLESEYGDIVWERVDKLVSLALNKAGIAGIKYLDGSSRGDRDGTYNYVVFDDSRVAVTAKYSIPERGAPAPLGRSISEPDFSLRERLLDAARDLVGNQGGREDAAGSALDRFRTAFQDRMLPVLRVQQAVEQILGRKLAERENPYLGEELLSGKTGARVERLYSDMVEPLFETMSAAGISVAQLEDYLYARHAPERNARISAINEKFGEGEGSGMTDAEAAAIMAEVERSPQRDAIKALAARVDDILQFSVDTRVEAGLLSQAEADAWRAQYQHYVPLRGRAELDPEFGQVDRPTKGGSGITVRGKESKRALGRASRAEDILAYSVMQAEEAIMRAETNAVGQQFLELAKAAPDLAFWTVDKVSKKPVWNSARGQVEYRSENRISADDAPYTVSLKVDGTEHRITLNRDNPAAVRVADAMRNLSAQQMAPFVRYLGAFTRLFSALNTRWSPEFLVTNAFRDIQSASVNLAQHDVDGLISGTVRDWRKALMAPTDGTGEWGKWRREFELAGGKVYFSDRSDLRSIKDRIDKLMTRQDGVSLKSGFNAFLGAIDAVNDRVENAVRLAAYKNAREGGMSKAAAASVARNATVNFTRRGKFGAVANSFYAFFNASVQGSATLAIAAARSPRVRRALVGLVMLGFVSDMLNRWGSDDDDDGESFWSKVPDYDKEKNLYLFVPGWGDAAIKVPMGLGLNAFISAGRNISEIFHGRSAAEAGGEAVATALDAFNPLGSGSLLTKLLPTALDPVAELATNRNFADKPIAPERSRFEKEIPDSENYFPSVSSTSKAVARGLNAATGGDEVVAGGISISPEVMDYLAAYYTGGVGRFVQGAAGIATAPFDPDRDLTLGDIPFARKVVNEKPRWLDKSLFYDRVNQVEATVENVKEYADRGQARAGRDYAGANADVLALRGQAKSARKRMRDLRKERGALESARDENLIDAIDYRQRKTAIDESERDAISRFNTVWNERVAKP